MLKNKILLPCITTLFIGLLSANVFAHEHTNDCYAGTIHSCDGNETTYGLCYTTPIYHKHTNDCYSNECKATDVTITKNDLESICSICNSIYIEEIISCNHCGATSANYFYCSNETCENYKKENINITHNTLTEENKSKYGELICEKNETNIDKYEKTCQKENNAYYYGSEKVNPICDKVVITIKPVEEIQTTNNPNLKLLATYLDGHTAEIDATSTSYLSNMTYTNAQIQLNYYGLCQNASSYGNLNTVFVLSTPTQIPTPTITNTPTPIQEPTPTIEPTQILTPTPTIVITPTNEPTTIPNPYETQEPTIEITKDPTIRPTQIDEPIEEIKSNNGLIIALGILIVVSIIFFTILNIFLFKDDDNEEDDEYDDDEYDDDDDEYEYDDNNNSKTNQYDEQYINKQYQTTIEQSQKDLSNSIQQIMNEKND